MQQRYFSFLLLLTVFIFPGAVLANVPQIVGLGGGGTAGVPKDALFSNPAGVVGLKSHRAFFSYSQSKIRDLGAGGRIWATGVYDGKSRFAKGGLSYIRESRRRLSEGESPYLDSQTVRGIIGRPIVGNLFAGSTVNYKMKRENGKDINLFTADFGLIYPLFSDVPIGLKAENLGDTLGEGPRALTLGVQYDISGPIVLIADYGRTISQQMETKNNWSLATEVSLFKELVIRGALFKSGVDALRGFAVGASWNGPRTAFEYAMRVTRGAPTERDHVLGLSLQF